MNRLQIIVIGLAIALFLVLYLGGRTKPLSRAEIDKSRALSATSVSINDLQIEAKATLEEATSEKLAALEEKIKKTDSDTARINALKQISGTWYDNKRYLLSGHYAEQIAEIVNTDDEAWSIAGISYTLAFRNAANEELFKYAFDKATTAFKKAQQINPANTSHSVNLGMCYIQNPATTMQGVKTLQAELERNPNNLSVLLTLGKLSVTQTRDYNKALPRLEKAVAVAPNNFEANYYLAETYKGLEQKEKALDYYNRCLALTDDATTIAQLEKAINELN